MDLSSYLLKPVQRMGKYALILKQILKECPESAAEYQDLTAAQDMIKFCLQHGNDLLGMEAIKVSRRRQLGNDNIECFDGKVTVTVASIIFPSDVLLLFLNFGSLIECPCVIKIKIHPLN